MAETHTYGGGYRWGGREFDSQAAVTQAICETLMQGLLVTNQFSVTAPDGAEHMIELQAGFGPETPAFLAPHQMQERREAAARACRLLVHAYDKGLNDGGHIDWSDVDAAAEQAYIALGRSIHDQGRGPH